MLLMRHMRPMLVPFQCCVCSIECALIVQADELHVVEPVANVFETNQHNHPVSVSVCVQATQVKRVCTGS